MLPPAPVFIRGIEFFLRRQDRQARLDPTLIADALSHAALLAAGSERDEPAALLFACASRSQAFAPEAARVVPHVARSHAGAVGLELRVAEVALTIHHARILRGQMSFDELRDWFAARLVPIDRG